MVGIDDLNYSKRSLKSKVRISPRAAEPKGSSNPKLNRFASQHARLSSVPSGKAAGAQFKSSRSLPQTRTRSLSSRKSVDPQLLQEQVRAAVEGKAAQSSGSFSGEVAGSDQSATAGALRCDHRALLTSVCMALRSNHTPPSVLHTLRCLLQGRMQT